MSLHFRLSLLLFLGYSIPGAWIPLFSLHLQDLQFTPLEMSLAFATTALANLIAPVLAGQVADRWVSCERCISFGSLAVAGFTLLLAEQTSPMGVFWCSLGTWFFLNPILTLNNSLSFTHLSAPEREFGQIRMWGTIGWASSAFVLFFWFSNPTWLVETIQRIAPGFSGSQLSDCFRVSAMLAVILSLYAWTLPRTPPAQPDGLARLDQSLFRRLLDAPLQAATLFRQRAFAVFCACSLGIYLTIPFPSQLTPLFLKELGIAREFLPPTLTMGQSLEILTLFLLPMLLLRLEVRGTMLLGLLAWVVAMTILTVGRPTWLVVLSLGLNGVCVACFLVVGQLFINSRAGAEYRASAQALLNLINGVGILLGNFLVGAVRQLSGDNFSASYGTAAAMAGVLILLFILGFSTVPEGTAGETTPAPSFPCSGPADPLESGH